MPFNAPTRERGSSIVQVLVGVALLGIIAAGAAGVAEYFAKNIQHAELNGDVRDLRDYIARNIDCSAIVGSNTAACDAGEYVNLYDKRSGTCTLVAPVWPHQTPIANEFFVRAKCSKNVGTGGYDINVEYAVGKVGTTGITFRKDPINGQLMDFKGLFSTAVACNSNQYKIPSGYWVRAFLNNAPGVNVSLSKAIMPMRTEDTFQKLCGMIGYPEIKARPGFQGGYKSCSDNALTYWDKAQQKFIIEWACYRNYNLWAGTNSPLTCQRQFSQCP